MSKQFKEAPEMVVLKIQSYIYELKDARENLSLNVRVAEAQLESAKSALNHNMNAIDECAAFLDEHCPDAVRGTWKEEIGIDS